jgi:hypothetical protein
VPFGFAAGAIGSVATGLIGANASKSAANTQANAANTANQTELGMFNQTRQDLQPFMGAGTNALTSLQNLLGIGAGGAGAGSPVLAALGIGPGGQVGGATSPFQQSPGYQFAKQQGIGAATNATAGRGGMGGNTLKALTQFGTGIANQDYYNYLNALNSAWGGLTGALGGISNLGENAAAKTGAFGADVASSIGGNTIGAGNAQAAGTIGSTNAITGGVNNSLQSLIAGLNSPNGSNLINSWLTGGNQPAISGVNSASLFPADASMTAAPVNYYAGGVGGAGY